MRSDREKALEQLWTAFRFLVGSDLFVKHKFVDRFSKGYDVGYPENRRHVHVDPGAFKLETPREVTSVSIINTDEPIK